MEELKVISEEPRIDPFRFHKALWEIVLCSIESARSFGISRTIKTALVTLANILRERFRKNLRQFDPGLTVITFTIHPDMSRIWYWFASRMVDSSATIIIVDCAGFLNPKKFPRAKIHLFCNFQHGRKIDYFLYHVVRTKYVWLSDDDVIPVASDVWREIQPKFEADTCLAAVSLRARGWELEWKGVKQRCMGPYSLIFDREKFCLENLSFRWVKTTNERIAPGRSPGRFDVADYAHFQLMRRGYRVEIVEERKVAGFVGVSRALMRTLKTRGQVEKYILSQITSNPNHALGEIEAQYCAWLVYDLYRSLFRENPFFTPPVPRERLIELASMVSGSIWSDPVGRLRRWEDEYAILCELAKKGGEQFAT